MIRIGPAGWHYKDWQGLVYPNPEPRGFRELAYLAGFFDVVEINTSFYGPPRPAAVKSWIGQVADNPRWAFAGEKVLYKLYLIRELAEPNEPLETDACVEFMCELLPALKNAVLN